MNVAITGCRLYEDKRKIKQFIFKLKEQFGEDVHVLSAGSKSGPDIYAKKYSLDFGLNYTEYNPTFTSYTLYSRFTKESYGKPYHVSQFHRRNDIMVEECDFLVCFMYDSSPIKNIEGLIKAATRLEKKYVIIN